MNNLTFLVVGSGSISQRHIKNLKKISSSNKIILVKRKQSQSKLFIKPDKIIENYKNYPVEKINAVILANPSSLREKIAGYFIKNKKPIFFEKPITNTKKSAEKIQKYLKKDNVTIMVGYCLRYLESLIFFKEILSSCKFGKIRSAQISFSQHLSLWRKNLNYEDSVSAKKQLGGGILLEMSHELDYIQWIFGNIKKGVGYSHQVKDLKMNVPNHADFIIKTTKNILVNIHMDMLSEIPQRRCKVLCENGTVLWDYNKNLVKWKINGQNVREKKFSKKEKNQMYETEIKNFIEIITKKKKRHINLKSSIELIKVIENLNTLKL